MEIRKVQKSGNSSFIVSLPAEWVKTYNIAKNDPVEMETNWDGSLTILPKHAPAREEENLIVQFNGEQDRSIALRKLIGGYISGFCTMEVVPTPSCISKARLLSSEFTSMVIGQQVVDDDGKRIVIKDISNSAQMPMKKTVQRMYRISSDTLMQALEPGSFDQSRLSSNENEVDKLQWLVARKHNTFLRYPSLASKEEITLPESNLYFVTSRHIERISDHALLVSRHLCSWKNSPAPSLITQNGKHCISLYSKTMQALSTLDEKLANSTIDDALGMQAGFEQAFSKCIEHPSSKAISLIYTLTSLRRIAEYSAGISESVIDFASQKKN
ncbi:MAG: AbrB/MazE/SpoVT family DNA-binding domain-containing protein [Candidatus Micrarchaeia archaeon]